MDGLVDPDHILVVTIQSQIEMLHDQVPAIPMENYLVEPMPKGTAAVVGFAATYLRKQDADAVMAILTADHVMDNIGYFREILLMGAEIAKENTLVTIGIKPEFAATGFGYIETAETRENGMGLRVNQFVEKPDQDTAQKYFKSGNYFWNSGMFIWTVDAILEEIERQMPDLFSILNEVDERITEDGRVNDILDVWEQIEPETVDYGIMEGARDVTLIPALELGWKDLGSWDSLFTILKPDEWGNIGLAPKIININSRDCFVQGTNEEKIIAVIGVDDLIVVDHENSLLICKKGESQKVKQIVQKIKDDNLKQYL